MNLHEDEVPVAVGRGRGRGRGRGGGTAILPQGIWNEIVVNRDEDDEDINDFEANIICAGILLTLDISNKICSGVLLTFDAISSSQGTC